MWNSLAPALTPLALAALALPTPHDEVKPLLPSLPGPSYRAADWGRGGGFPFKAGQAFEAHDAVLLARLSNEEAADTLVTNDCWGYVSPSGREYAIWCHYIGTHFVDVTIAGDPKIIGFVPGSPSSWRDAKVYQQYCYLVCESSASGIQVVDLSNVDAGLVHNVGTVTSGPSTLRTHNVALDEVSGFLYRCGGSDNGLRIYDLANPAAPAYVGQWADRYVHDAQVVTYETGPYAGREIAFCLSGFNGGGTQTGLSIVDVTDKQNPVHRGQVTWPGAAYSHQGWLSEDRSTFYINDEQDEDGSFPSTIYRIDVTDLDAPSYVDSFTNGNTAVTHNLYVDGDRLYAANYKSGLRVFDLGAGAPTEIAWFDSSPLDDAPTFNGMWSNYPYFPSGVVACSDKEGGLFLVWVGPQPVAFALPAGAPEQLDAGGDSFTVQIAEASPGDYLPGSAKLFYDAGYGAVEAPLSDLGGGAFEAAFGELPCGANVRYYLTAQSSTGATWVEPPNGATYGAIVVEGGAAALAFADHFDTDLGWTVGAVDDDATGGLWTRVDPNGTLAQSEDDGSPFGDGFCFVTGQGEPLGAAADSDVDQGKTTLTSPPLDLFGPGDFHVSYRRWYSNALLGFPEEDVLVVEVSNDGFSWVTAETVGPGDSAEQNGWRHAQFRVADFVAPSATVQVRFVASDYGGESLVEAGIDDFTVTTAPCGDCNGDGGSDDLQLAGGELKDFDWNGEPDICLGLSVDKIAISTFLGGQVAFELNADDALAGQVYLLLGTLAGPEPGFDLGAVHVPLNQDVYFHYSLAHANSGPLVTTFGLLDGDGDGDASFALPPGFLSLIGAQAHHAWIAVDPLSLAVTFASNAQPLTFNF